MDELTVCLETDSYETMAWKIFNYFQVHQSCTIIGVHAGGGILDARGAMVWKEIQKLDEKENTERNRSGFRRKRKLIPDSIGGYVAQKIFCRSMKVQDGVLRYVIWRYQ
jgi:hypothetical protein